MAKHAVLMKKDNIFELSPFKFYRLSLSYIFFSNIIILTCKTYKNYIYKRKCCQSKTKVFNKMGTKHEINVECKKVTQQHINDRFVTKELVFCKSASKFDNL